MTETTFKSPNGRRYLIRDLKPADAELLVDLFYHLSPETLYKRFHTVMDPDTLPIDKVRQLVHPLANIDPQQAVALIALAKSTAVGVARFHRVPGATDAESAIVVRDDYQMDGLGTALLTLLQKRALEAGITHFIALVQAQNHPILKVINRSGLESQWRTEQGETYLTVDIRSTPGRESRN